LNLLYHSRNILYKLGILKEQIPDYQYDYEEQNASHHIQHLLEQNAPCMISRFGWVEIETLMLFHCLQQGFVSKIKNYYQKKIHRTYLDKGLAHNLSNNAGFFPADKKHFLRFGELMLDVIAQINLLGSWKDLYLQEQLLKTSYFPNAQVIPAPPFEPYYHTQPWTSVLKNKKVLVVHPFEESIQTQYAKRHLLFENPDILPNFELKTLKAVLSLAGNPTLYPTWFDALDDMKQKIDTIDYDIALIGCGAYGMPLASHVKKSGKKAVHLGGALQILFGIKGKRWENHSLISTLFNQHWATPLPSETPQNYQKVEKGAYWL
jgi:hypothetical protein